MSQLEELSFNQGGVPMPEEMRKNLIMSEAVEESSMETKLGMWHSLSSVKYNPSKSEYKVKSAGDFLRKSLGKAKTFDPFAFSITKEAKEGEEAREKTLSVDFVVAKPIPKLAGEKKLLPAASELLAKAYNKFLFIGRCMEAGDERGVWTAIRDGVFAMANGLTRVHDARMTTLTGTTSYTTRANLEVGLVRQKVKDKIKKERGKGDLFFRVGGGLGDPPQFIYPSVGPNFISSSVLPPPPDPDDMLDDDSVGSSSVGSMASSSSAWGSQHSYRVPEGNRFGTMARGTDRSGTMAWPPRGASRSQRGRRGMQFRESGSGGRGRPSSSYSRTPDSQGSARDGWGNEEGSSKQKPAWGN
jgi:hypothetical protein